MKQKKPILNIIIIVLFLLFIIGIIAYFSSPIYLATKTTKLINELYVLDIQKSNLENTTEFPEQLSEGQNAVIYYDNETKEFQIYFHQYEDRFLPMNKSQLKEYYKNLTQKKKEISTEINNIIKERKAYQ